MEMLKEIGLSLYTTIPTGISIIIWAFLFQYGFYVAVYFFTLKRTEKNFQQLTCVLENPENQRGFKEAPSAIAASGGDLKTVFLAFNSSSPLEVEFDKVVQITGWSKIQRHLQYLAETSPLVGLIGTFAAMPSALRTFADTGEPEGIALAMGSAILTTLIGGILCFYFTRFDSKFSEQLEGLNAKLHVCIQNFKNKSEVADEFPQSQKQ
jgi:biopolymer transport protein ExbB/TolQ